MESTLRWLQFFLVSYYLICIIILSVLSVYFFMKNNSKTTFSRIIIVYLLSLFFYIIRVIEEAMLFDGNAYVFRCLQDITLVLLSGVALLLVYYTWGKKLFGTIALSVNIFTVILISTNSYHHQYILEYGNHYVKYGAVYKNFSYFNLFLIIVSLVVFISKKYIEDQSGNKNGVYLHILEISVYISYILWIQNIVPMELELHIYLLFISTVVLAVIAMKYMPRLILPNYFAHIVENILEAIIVTDEKGHVLYMNNTNISKYFTNIDNITPSKITTIFKEGMDVSVLDSTSDNIDIEMKSGNEKWLINCKIKAIKRNDSIDGYVYILSDFTYLQRIIDDLNKKNNELIYINEELENHSEVASSLEQELENNKIINELEEYLGGSYLNLYHVLDKSLKSLKNNEKDTVAYIDEAIDLARDSLSNVRSVVVKYNKKNYE